MGENGIEARWEEELLHIPGDLPLISATHQQIKGFRLDGGFVPHDPQQAFQLAFWVFSGHINQPLKKAVSRRFRPQGRYRLKSVGGFFFFSF
jgi:hypothetical protein